MSKVIGIDLGTTNSVMSIRVLKSDIIPNAEGELLTPSVVFYGEKSLLVGQPALDLFLQNPETTVRSVKRLMGRSISDPEIQRLIKTSRFSYKLAAASAGTTASLVVQLKNQQELTPAEISSEILKKIKNRC